jgi:hypothetical protein
MAKIWDRFETKLLPKVVVENRESMKEGAEMVMRALNGMHSKKSLIW